MRRPLLLLALLPATVSTPAARLDEPSPGGELRFSLRAEPKHFNPFMVSEEPDEIVRFLTAGVLVRLNRQTQAVEGELAESWRVLDGGRQIEFRLRQGVRFSDGSDLTPADVLSSLRAVFDPATTSPAGDPFRTGKGPIEVTQAGCCRVLVRLPAPMAGAERLFDQVPITSLRAIGLASQPARMPVLGPFRIAEYRPGVHVLLARNLHYWKKDEAGRQLPYLDAVRLLIQQNRDLEFLRFLRGQIHLINNLEPEAFDRLAAAHPDEARDAGRSRDFRVAISQAINRADLARLVYRGRPFPPSARCRPPIWPGSTRICARRPSIPPPRSPASKPPASRCPAPRCATATDTPSSFPSSPTPATSRASVWPA